MNTAKASILDLVNGLQPGKARDPNRENNFDDEIDQERENYDYVPTR